jgi:tape measure domain-containing protein
MSEIIGSASYELNLDDKQFEQKLKTASTKFKDFGDSITKVGQGLTTALTLPLLGFGMVAVSSAADAEQLEVALTTMLGSAEDAGKMIKDMTEFAKTTPFQLTDIEKSTKSMLAFGISAEDIIPSLKMIGDVASGVGIPLTDLATIYGKARTQGTLFAEDINQLTERGVPIIAQLAEQFGIAESEVRDLVSTGAVGFDDLEQAFADMTGEGGQFFNLMLEQSKTTAGQWSNLQDTFNLVARDIGILLLPVMNDLINKLSGFLQTIKDLSPAQKDFILKLGVTAMVMGPLLIIVGKLVGIVGTLIPIIGTLATVLMGPIGIIALVVIAIGTLIYSFGLVEPIIERIKGAFATLKTTWDTLKQAFASPEVQSKLAELQLKFQELEEKLRPLFERVGEAFNKILEPFDKIFGEGSSIFTLEGAIAGISGAIDTLIIVVEFLTPVFELAVGVIIKVIDVLMWLNDTVQKVIAFFMNFDENMKKLWEDFKLFVTTKINELGDSIYKLFTEDIPLWLGFLFASFLKFIEELPANLVRLKDSIISKFEEAKTGAIISVQTLIDSVINFFKTLPDRVRSEWDRLVFLFVEQIPAMYNIGSDIVQGLWNGLKAKMSSVLVWVKETVEKIKNSFKKGMEIASPSKVFTYYGSMIGAGLQQGLEQSVGSAQQSLNKLVKKITPSKDSQQALRDKMNNAFGGGFDNASFSDTTRNLLSKHASSLSDSFKNAMASAGLGDLSSRLSSMTDVMGGAMNFAGSGFGISSEDIASIGSRSDNNSGFNVTLNMAGIITRSRAEFRDVIADGIEAVNEDLVARGYQPIGDGKVKGRSTAT